MSYNIGCDDDGQFGNILLAEEHLEDLVMLINLKNKELLQISIGKPREK